MKKKFIASIIFACLFSQQADASGRDVALGALLGVVGTVIVGKVVIPLFSSPENMVGISAGEYPTFQFPQIIFPEDEALSFIGQDHVLEQVGEFLDAFMSHNTYKELGAKKPKALFLEGARGNGKTLLARVIAQQLDAFFIPIDGHALADESSGPGEAKVRFIFDFAKEVSKKKLTILFVDNFDVLAKTTDYHQFNIQKRRAINAFAQLIRAIDDDENLIIIGAGANSLELDSTLFSPGCFDRVVHIPLPTREGRAALLAHFLSSVIISETILDESFITQLIEETAGFSVRFLEDMVKEAALIAGQDLSFSVMQDHLAKACLRLKEKKQILCDHKQSEGFYYTFSESTKFSDVIGQEEVLVEVKEVVDFLKNPQRYNLVGARAPRGVLLHGPSGCGKTLIARAIAGEAGCCFISISGSEFVKKYVGTGPATVRLIFDFARKMAKELPVVIFIDEIDGLGHRKTLDSSGGQSEYNNTINEILRQMDGFTKDDNILVIGATNLVEELDQALLRAGRFDRKLLVPLMSKQGRQDILLYYLDKILLSPELVAVDIATEFAQRTAGLSGADLEQLVNEAAVLAVREDDLVVDRDHLEEAFDKVLLGPPSNIEQTDESLRRTAYHEAGHALVAILNGLPVTKVSILSRGNALGITFMGDDDGKQYTRTELLHKLMCSQAGYVAEQLIFDDVTPGASNDLKRASMLALDMIKYYGMGLGELECVGGGAFWSDAVRQRFDEAAIALLNQTFLQTKELLLAHKPKLIALADELLDKETLVEWEIEAICSQ